MGHLTQFLENVRQQTALKSRLGQRLFRSLYAGMEAAERDVSDIRAEAAAQHTAALEREQQLLQQTKQETEQLRQQHEQLRTQTEQLRQQLTAQIQAMEQTQAALSAKLDTVGDAVSAEGAIRQNLETLNRNTRTNNTRLDALQSDTELAKVKLAGLERKLREGVAVRPEHPEAAPTAPIGADAEYTAIDYFDFENHFRGSIEQIKAAQRQYLPYFAGKKHVLDLGCGRGEFLSLMQEEGIPAVGVDVYEPYADYCRMKGLEAHCGDGIAFLRQMEDVDGIFVGQVIEHLQIHQITALCEAAFDKLPEGGCIVMETPNPTSLAIYTNAFYIDPSHSKPVHPLTMQYLLEKAGFRKTELLYPEASRPPQRIPQLAGASEEFNEAMQAVSGILFGSQDYAIIAKK